MPAIVVCAACQTKLKVPENSSAKALRCPRCKGVVPVAAAEPKPAPPPPPKEEEFEVNEAVDEKDEEFEVNEAADEEEFEVNEASDEEESEDEEDAEQDEDSSLAALGFVKVKDVFKKGKIPDDARKAVEKAFTKKEKALWAGRPSQKIIESKAWIGLIAGPVCVLVGLSVCTITGVIAAFAGETTVKIVAPLFGGLFGLIFSAIGVLVFIFRKRIGGNVNACYVVTNKRAYVSDGRAGGQVRAFTAAQLGKMEVEASPKFDGAGDLVFAYDLMGNPGVQVDKAAAERSARHGAGNSSTAVGFLNIEDVQIVKAMIEEVLIEPARAREKAKRKKKHKGKQQQNRKLFG